MKGFVLGASIALLAVVFGIGLAHCPWACKKAHNACGVVEKDCCKGKCGCKKSGCKKCCDGCECKDCKCDKDKKCCDGCGCCGDKACPVEKK